MQSTTFIRRLSLIQLIFPSHPLPSLPPTTYIGNNLGSQKSVCIHECINPGLSLSCSNDITSTDRPILSKSCEDELNKIGITYGGFYYFFGRLVGKAVFDRQLLDVELPLTLISRINAESNDDVPRGSVKRLQKRPHIEELDRSLDIIQGMDPVLYASLQWILKNDITNVIYETFSVECSGESVDLCENGASIEVSENNKWEYVQLLCDWKIVHSVNAAVNSFLKGFYELVPSRELRDAGVTAEELLLMINGKQLVDIDEIRAYVVYQGSADFGEQHESVVWLWQALREFTDAERRDVLGFFTGSGRVPLDGFDPPLNITEGSDMSIDSLPRAHTCFNQVKSSHTLNCLVHILCII